ncbi:hypothetical protein [Methylobacterium longum]|uniref:Uncharacterized protein n=1 Tax=Methylobacterium longum TaxID=767694 RepID=A0ABT8APY8_9HYPH|nr:hypothetical protein [Methylobacterium longum]MDN3571879.1 hypothetical protein [Methylobacterium longum]GJE15146.1 hypothetical protein FOHLNKBM_6224 [Methylobacterium longum]
MRTALAALALVAAEGAAQAADCRIAMVLFGNISIDPAGPNGEAYVRQSDFGMTNSVGIIRGTITIGRDNLEVRDRDGAVVGQIEPDTGRILGFDEACDKRRRPRYLPIEKDLGAIINGDYLAGMVKGRMPR